MGFFLQAAALVIAAFSAAESIDEQKKANRRTEEFRDLQQRQSAVRNERSRRRSAAEAGVQVARIQAAGAALGAASGATASGFESAAIGVQSQSASNIGFQRQLELLDRRRFSAQSQLLSAQRRAGEFGTISALSLAAFKPLGNTGSTGINIPQDT